MQRGRPVFSEVRQNIVEILHYRGKGYGYDIYKAYCDLFPKVTLRLMYYHLRKGAELGEFAKKEIKQEKGEYSWGNSVEKIYYNLGPNAKPAGIEKVRKYFEKKE